MFRNLEQKIREFIGDLYRELGKIRCWSIIIFGFLGIIATILLGIKITFLRAIFLLISVVFFFVSCSWEYGLFALSFIICCIFIFSPIILCNSETKIWVSTFLSELMSSDYKATYIESLGSMLGAFLAIAGALSVERHIKDKEEADQDVLNARIIYYDLHFAFKQIKEVLEESNKTTTSNAVQKPNAYTPYDQFATQLNSYLVLIDNDWIRTISALPESKISEQEREHLYQLYDMICNIRRAIENCPKEYNSNKKPWEDVYLKMFKFSVIAPSGYRPTYVNFPLDQQERDQREVTENVWKTLKKYAKIS